MATLSELEKDFKTLIKNEALGHAYALYGPYVPGQFTLAKSLANFLEHKKWEDPSAGSGQGRILLDAKFIDGTQQNLGVDVAREFSEFLYRQPVASPRRTLVINSAAEFTDQAQNAILKLVEEPPSHALIIITVRDVNSLLAPLRSRLQSLYAAPGKGERATVTELEEKADELVEKLLMSAPAGRSVIIKQIIADDKEDDVEKNQKITDTFLNRLILELSKKPEANVSVLKEALKRQTAMADYSTNKKLQLEAILQYLR